MSRVINNTELVAKIEARTATTAERRLYAHRVSRRVAAPACKYGHPNCALVERGPCRREMLGAKGQNRNGSARTASLSMHKGGKR
jgi:hypothetical protein